MCFPSSRVSDQQDVFSFVQVLSSQELLHRLLHLGISSLVTHPPNAVLDPLGGVSLFLRYGLVFFDDLYDPLKVGANLRLGAGLLQTISRRLRMGHYLL
jgi:hypothetical protein